MVDMGAQEVQLLRSFRQQRKPADVPEETFHQQVYHAAEHTHSTGAAPAGPFFPGTVMTSRL
jgi:hypothetical protein